MRSLSMRLFAGVLLASVCPFAANAATTTFGPTAYLQHGDTPADFICDDCPLYIEDFEDGMLSDFLSIDNGMIFPPNGTTGTGQPSTDSVDGDDGSVDGFGLEAYSWFSGDVASIEITFAEAVKSAGLVFTDGDKLSSTVLLEALDMHGNVIETIDAGDLADDSFFGETEEDRFLGFSNAEGVITGLRISIDAGSGIEIDHIQWQSHLECIPEPAANVMALFAIMGLYGFRRKRD